MIMKNRFDLAAPSLQVPALSPPTVPTVTTVTTRKRSQRHWPTRGEVRRRASGAPAARQRRASGTPAAGKRTPKRHRGETSIPG
jgi:hypothetical protein